MTAWIAVCCLIAPPLIAAQDRSEREIVDVIVREGPTARAIRAEADVVRHEQLARLAYPNPSVTYSREGAGFTEFIQVEQSLPLFGTRAALARAGVAASTAAEAERDARLWALRSDASAAVARVVFHETRVSALHGHARDVERLIDVLRVREREGEGSKFDRLRAEQELRDVRQMATAAAIEVVEARAALAAMLPEGAPVGRIAAAPGAAQAVAPVEELMTRATNARAELRALANAMQRTEFEADAARRARLPSPTIASGLKRADEGADRRSGGVIGVSVSLPLFDTGSREAARWTAERSRLDAERAALHQRIRSEIVQAIEAVRLREDAVAADEEGAGAELTQIADVAYREGEVGILELLDAVRTASRARLRSIELRLEARLARITLERAVGDVLWP